LFVARHDGTDIRINKEITTLINNNQYILTIVNGNINNQLYKREEISTIELSYRFNSKFINLIYLYLVFTYVLVSNHRSIKNLHLVDEETIFVAIIGKLLRKTVVLDLFDSIALKFSNSSHWKRLIALCVSSVYKRIADCILYTDQSRLKLNSVKSTSHKSIVLQNYPTRSTLPVKLKNKKHDLLVSGTLYKDRGIDIILQNLDIFQKYDIAVLGWVKDSFAKRLIQLENVTYYGVVSAEDALDISAQCRCNFIFYNPNNLNNIYASPNKIYDSLALGQMIWCNEELNLLQDFAGNEYFFTTPYHDITNAPDLENLIIDESIPSSKSPYFWENIEKNLLNAHGVSHYVET